MDFGVLNRKKIRDTSTMSLISIPNRTIRLLLHLVGSGLQHVEKPRSSRELPRFLLSPKIKIFGDPMNDYSFIKSCITTLAEYATGVPGPKMAATPALYKKS